MSDNSSSLPSAGSAYRSGLAKPTIGATTISLLATAATGAAAASLAPGLAPAAVDMIEAGTAILGAGFGWYLGVREKGSLWVPLSEVASYLPSLPNDSEGVKVWYLCLSVGYLILRKFVAFCRRSSSRITVAQLGDMAAFSGSVLVGIGLLHPATLTAIGDTTLFLIIGCLGGLFYSIEELFSEGKKDASKQSETQQTLPVTTHAAAKPPPTVPPHD